MNYHRLQSPAVGARSPYSQGRQNLECEMGALSRPPDLLCCSEYQCEGQELENLSFTGSSNLPNLMFLIPHNFETNYLFVELLNIY